MLEIDCNCGWTGSAPTREELLVIVKAHAEDVHPNDPRDEGTLRAVIAQTAREVS
jgi:predicted small metal-binding protein